MTPRLGSIVQKGKFALCAFALDRQLNRVDLPTLGSPTMPHLRAMIGGGLGGKDNAGVGLPIFLHFVHRQTAAHQAGSTFIPEFTCSRMSSSFPLRRLHASAPRHCPHGPWRQLRSLTWVHGCTDFLVKLYFEEMNVDPANWSMDGKGEDLFFLSNGHISPVWYSVLSRRGYFPVEELATFGNWTAVCRALAEEGLPGIRVASGSLGQGLSVACGAAQAKKLNGEDTWVYSLHGDRGELRGGPNLGSGTLRRAPQVDNLISFVDYNGQQIDGSVEDVMSLGDLGAKWAAFGWAVLECNSLDLGDLDRIFKEAARSRSRKPVVVLMRTDMGKGVDFMEGTHKWHGVAPNDEQLATALDQLTTTLADY